MSKLYRTYLRLKKQNPNTIYLFKSGIFFLAIDNDAYTLSNIFDFKLGKLNDTVIKCGFPCSSFNKYSNLFRIYNLAIKIVELDNSTSYTITEYSQSESINELLEIINSVDIDNLSISEAYRWIEDLKIRTAKITNGDII